MKLLKNERYFGHFKCSRCGQYHGKKQRTEWFYELRLSFDDITDSSGHTAMSYKVGNFCESCWQERVGYEVHFVNWALEEHQFDEFLEYVNR